ncbi:MAG: hypothetical protein NWE84_00065 [Candidatus Bathyarchaeota archaeon]|nr:hypothetical protein [Candidatus Bathyarchaeota archaeon]
MRYIIIFSIIFVLSGVILVSGSLFMGPYTVREPFRVDRSKTWIDDTFTLQPNSNRTYILDSIAQNWSIFQMDLKPSLPMVFTIRDYIRGELVFEWLRGGTIFWTAPSITGIWVFVFQNPSSTAMNVSANVTEYYPKVTEYRDVTYYRSVFDPIYGYVGMAVLVMVIGVNAMYISRELKKRN